MRSSASITKVVNGLYTDAIAGLTTMAETRKDSIEKMLGLSGEEKLNAVGDIIHGIQVNVRAPRVDYVGYPDFIGKTFLSESDENVAQISIRSRQKAGYKFRKDVYVNIDGDFIQNAGKVYADALTEMLYIQLAMENVEDLNAKLVEVAEAANLGYTVSFDVVSDSKSAILSIDDNGVVFNADINKALDLANMALFRSGDEYEDLVSSREFDRVVAAISSAQTPVQLIKTKTGLVEIVANMTTKRRANKIIRGAYHKNVKYKDSVKAGVFYFDEDVEVNGETINVFSLVSKDEDGKLSVVLSPFNTEDSTNVDFDVVKAIGA